LARQRKSLKTKIASLSALGAGALIAGAGRAEASTFYGPVNVDVGPNGLSQYGLILDGLNTVLSFAFAHTMQVGNITHITRYSIRGFGQKPFSAQFSTTGGTGHLLRLVSSGAVFGSHAGSNVFVGGRTWGTLDGGQRSAVLGNNTFSLEYALFKFTPAGGPTEYGWLLLSYSVSKGFGANAALGPDLNILNYAYDNSGNPLAAGAGVPEPGTMTLTGLGALALGAIGLRRWRKSSQAV
jgi:hypothetical protein